jgi:hypothetical protein
MCGRRLVSLASVTGADEVLYKRTVARKVEVLSEANEGLLDALVTSCVDQRHHLMMQIAVARYEDLLAVEQQALGHAPGAVQCPSIKLLEELASLLV